MLVLNEMQMRGIAGGEATPTVTIYGRRPEGHYTAAEWAAYVDSQHDNPSVQTGAGDGGAWGPGVDTDIEPVTNARADAASNGIGVKDGVNMDHLGSEIVAAFAAVAAAYASVGATPVITSANDGTHMAGSQHYANQAIDLRANNITSSAATAIVAALQAALGSNYFVQFESFSSNPSNNHIHIQTVK